MRVERNAGSDRLRSRFRRTRLLTTSSEVKRGQAELGEGCAFARGRSAAQARTSRLSRGRWCGTGKLRADLIVKNHVQQRAVDLDRTVVFDEAHLAKAVHEEADTRSGRSHHLCQRFLADLRNHDFRLVGFAE